MNREPRNLTTSLMINGLKWTGRQRNPYSSSHMGKRLFYSPGSPDRLWHQPSLLCNGYEGFIPGVNMPKHLVLRLCVKVYALHSPKDFMAWCQLFTRPSSTELKRKSIQMYRIRAASPRKLTFRLLTVLDRCPIRISARSAVILTEVFRCFPHFL